MRIRGKDTDCHAFVFEMVAGGRDLFELIRDPSAERNHFGFDVDFEVFTEFDEVDRRIDVVEVVGSGKVSYNARFLRMFHPRVRRPVRPECLPS